MNETHFLALGPARAVGAPRLWERDRLFESAGGGGGGGGGGASSSSSEPLSLSPISDAVSVPVAAGARLVGTGFEPELFLFFSNLYRMERKSSSDRTTKIERT